MTMYMSAAPALVMNVLVPVMRYPSPSGSARVCSAAASLPPPGSVSANAASHSPEARRGRYRIFCSSLPKSMIGSVPTDACTSMMTAALASAAATASMKSTKSRWLPPPPPNRAGGRIPASPASPAAPTTSFGRGPMPRAIAAAFGRTKSRTKAAMRSPITGAATTSVDTDESRLALRDAAADPGGAVATPAAAQLVEKSHQDARAAGADRMPDRDGAAIDVDQLGVDLQHARAGYRYGGKGLVDLHESQLFRVDFALCL